MFLFDTNVVSEIRKIAADRADPNVERWVRSVDRSSSFISVVTLHELEIGVARAERSDAAKGRVLRQWLDQDVVDAFERRMLPIDAEVAREAAALHVPDPSPINDSFIAATALVHGLAVVTRDVSDYGRFEDVHVINPWSPLDQ